MLDELTASNLGIIASGRIEVDPGLTVISGETGTGKTVMLGALRLLRGEKAGKGLIGPSGDTCEVSARFFIDDATHVLRRRIDAKRSRAWMDDAAVTLSALAATLDQEVAIVGQHDQHRITSSPGVRALVDRLLDDDGAGALGSYVRAWDAYRLVAEEASELDVDARALERERDMLRYQASEIDAAGLVDGEDAELESRVRLLRNAAGLRADLDRALTLLGDDETGDRLAEALRILQRSAAFDSGLTEAAGALEGALHAIAEAAGNTAIHMADAALDPSDLDGVEQRLADVNQLKRKYGETIEEVLTFAASASDRLVNIDDLIERAGTIEARLAEALDAAKTAGERLRAARAASASDLASGAREHLLDLGFNDPIVDISVTEAAPSAAGADNVTILFASDAALTPAPIAKIASGGELSRLVLSLTLAAGAAEAAVIAFDEIDAGVGGNTALAMGRKLAELATERQVLCVTHLPQVAAFAGTHYTVERAGSSAELVKVEGEARVAELTRMLSGLPESEKGREHAEELIALAQR